MGRPGTMWRRTMKKEYMLSEKRIGNMCGYGNHIFVIPGFFKESCPKRITNDLTVAVLL